MNRAYALNRDKLKCRVCGGWLITNTPWAHRINPYLPLDKVNGDNNLASLHKKCFIVVNNPDLYDSDKNPIGEYTTDQDGYIYIDDELTPGKYYLRELEAAEGYICDEQYKTVYVEEGKCAQIKWENSAVTGQIQVRKYALEDNPVTGQRTGEPLEGAVFEITRARSGAVVDHIVTDARGMGVVYCATLLRLFSFWAHCALVTTNTLRGDWNINCVC